jgi:hypothetical protein
VLLISLDPAVVTGARDIGNAIRLGDVTLSRSDVATFFSARERADAC